MQLFHNTFTIFVWLIPVKSVNTNKFTFGISQQYWIQNLASVTCKHFKSFSRSKYQHILLVQLGWYNDFFPHCTTRPYLLHLTSHPLHLYSHPSTLVAFLSKRNAISPSELTFQEKRIQEWAKKLCWLSCHTVKLLLILADNRFSNFYLKALYWLHAVHQNLFHTVKVSFCSFNLICLPPINL